METKIVTELLKKVHEFYPIGLPHLNNIYPGYKELLSITEKKINNLIEKKADSWDNMVISLAKETTTEIRDESFLQFPNRSLRLEFSDQIYSDLIIRKNIHLYVSLLLNRYTYFVKQEFIVNGKHVLSLVSTQQEENNTELLKLVGNKMKDYYNDYSYVSHKVLLSYNIQGGTPHGEIHGSDANYPIFSFLFGLLPDYKIISIQD
jgi:hypothetical protein